MHEVHDEELVLRANRLSLEEKILLLTGRDSWSLHPLPRIGLRSIVVSDGPAGVRGQLWDERSPSTNYPSPTALAASWSPESVRSVGRSLGAEARRKNVDVILAPTINLHRSPFGGRHFEAFSEDPLLTSRIASEYVTGIQEHGVGATVKHYVANESETDRFTVDVRVDERTLRELYLAAFEGPIVDAGVWMVMSAYNSINGATASANPLLTTPLTDEWGFDGVVISDWTAVRSVESARHPQDLAMPGPDGAWGAALVSAVRDGRVTEDAIDRKVIRILRLAARVGALEGITPAVTAAPPAGEPPRAVARAAAVEGTVLLANDGVLPLRGSPSIALIGEGATVARTQGGGSATVIPDTVVSPLEGLRRRWPEADIQWRRGALVDTRPSPLPLETISDLRGEPGVTVRYIDSEGGELSREHRAASTIVSFGGPGLATASAATEMIFRWKPDHQSGEADLAILGLCDFTVSVDGSPVAAGGSRTRPGDDFATAVLTPPFSVVRLPVSPGGSDVVVRFTPVPGGIPDAAAFGVGVPAALTADSDTLIHAAAESAARQDVAIVVVSTSAEVESEGFDRGSLSLPGRQDDLVRAVAAANPRTIVVVNSGAPVTLPWREEVAALLAVWFPGQEFGDALADVISGNAEPGGRLPVSWPGDERDVPVSEVAPTDGRLHHTEGLHIGYRAWMRAGATPAYVFGHGLGYTEHELSGARVSAASDRSVTFETSVRNVGPRPGKAVVQFYLERTTPSTWDRPARWLAGFDTIHTLAGDETVASTLIDWRRFAHWDEGWKLEPGEFLLTAALSADTGGPSSTISIDESGRIAIQV